MTALLRRYAPPDTEIMGVDLTAADVAARNLEGAPGVTVREADLLGDLSGLGSFDFIYCQEVLHHTSDPEAGVRNLAGLLSPGGADRDLRVPPEGAGS